MDSYELTEQKQAPRSLDKWGLLLRVGFFVFIVFLSVQFITSALYWAFGALIAGAVGLCLSGLLANLLTLRIFDRRSLADIGLQLNPLAGRNLLTGLVFGGGTAALMLLMPILGGTGHLVLKHHSDFQWSGLAFYTFAIFIAAAGEEMMFRGYAFQILIEKMGPSAHAPSGRVVRPDACLQPECNRAGSFQHYPLGSDFGLRVPA